MRRTALATLAALVLHAACPVAAGEVPETASAAFKEGLRRFEEATAFRGRYPARREEARKRFRKAAEAFVRAWREGANTPQVLTNAANAYVFAGDLGEAVLFYRRALLVDPANVRARKGLESVRRRLPIRSRPRGGESLARSLFFWHDTLALETRMALFGIAYVLGWVFAAAALFSARRRRRFAGAALAFFVGAAFPFGSLAVEALGDESARAAVLLVETQGRTGDGEHYSPSHNRPLPAGTEVIVEERRAHGSAEWLRVRLLDGSDSWVPQGSVEFVLPREPHR